MIVIGGAGFIGSELCSLLSSREVEFSIFDKAVSNDYPDACHKMDVRDAESLARLPCPSKILVNLAAEHRDDVRPLSLYDDVNVLGAKNVCRFAEDNDIECLVFTSSVAVYGFAERGADEFAEINPFNDYGRTKYEAEQVYREWQEKKPDNRSLVVIRPTVIFGENNRGNVYNLFSQIASGRFLMIGDGLNRKSMAYVKNVCAFIEYSTSFKPGVHVYNYIDKPDFCMNDLVSRVKCALGRSSSVGFRIPYFIGISLGYIFDMAAKVSRKKLPISSIRIKKFCKDSVYNTAIDDLDFCRPISLEDALDQTIKHEFMNDSER